MYRAVIVDDEPFMLEGMRLMIDWNGCGFELCGESGSAQDALRLVDALRPHLLITDVRMPGMQGTDLAVIVRHYHPEVMILLFSVVRDFSCAQSAIRSGVFDYLVKPIDPDEVHETLRRVKTELDARATRTGAIGRGDTLRDQVLRRIAFGDDSTENLMRAGVLLELTRADPCYCAVLSSNADSVPENIKLLISGCGAIPFQLAPNQYGLRFRQSERDLPFLEQLLKGFSGAQSYQLSVWRVYRGAEGFAKSLREALDAQGVLFEPHAGLRLFRPVDAETMKWLADIPLARFHGALSDRDPVALEGILSDLLEALDASPGMFALRYMAASLDAMIPAGQAAGGAPLRALWQEEALQRDAWCAAFAATLRRLHAAARHARSEDWPAPVQAAVSVIRTRYAQPLSMADVAGGLGMNPAYLGQLVRRFTGVTFHRMLLDTRIEQACLLLRQTVRPVREIALEVGFRDVEYFSLKFRGRVGMSPVAYRCAESSKEESHAPPQ